MKKHYSNLTLLTSNIFFTTLRCFILIILSFSSSQKTVAQIAKNNYLKAPFVNESISSTDLSTNTITNFQILNGGSKLSFDIYSLRTSGTWSLGPSTYWVKYSSGMLINPVLTYMNPKFTIGSPTGSYNSASLAALTFSRKIGLQINYNGGTGDLVSDIPGVTGFGEKIASIQLDIIQIFTNFQWDPLNSGINTTSNTYVPSTFNGSFVPPPTILIQPNGGENFYSGSIQNISWLSSLSINLKIELTANNGGVWSVISSSYPAASGSFAWTIPNVSSAQCKIKISDANNPSLYDVSDNDFTISPVTINTGLVSYYPFNGNSNDESGNSKHGVNIGAILTTDNNGYSNRAYYFNGVNNCINIPNLEISNPENITLYALVKPLGNNDKIILYYGTGGEMQVSIYQNKFSIGVKLTNGYWYYVLDNLLIQEEWYSVSAVWQKGISLKLYVNGQLRGETALPNLGLNLPYPYQSTIGAYNGLNPINEARPFQGKIDEVRTYSRALSQSEIQQLYTTGQPVTITSPNGNETIINTEPDFKYDIKWDCSNNVQNVKLEYTSDGISWNYISNEQAYKKQFKWDIPDDINSSNCKIRITDINNSSVFDISDSFFGIITVNRTARLKFKINDPLVIVKKVRLKSQHYLKFEDYEIADSLNKKFNTKTIDLNSECSFNFAELNELLPINNKIDDIELFDISNNYVGHIHFYYTFYNLHTENKNTDAILYVDNKTSGNVGFISGSGWNYFYNPYEKLVYMLMPPFENFDSLRLDKQPVLFVHGIYGTYPTWGGNPFYIHNEYDAWQLYYPYDMKINDCSYILKKAINNILSGDPLGTLNYSSSNINIVAHSMGGLVSRYYIQGNSDQKVRKLLMLGTPNNGSFASYRASNNFITGSLGEIILGKDKESPALIDMIPGSNLLYYLKTSNVKRLFEEDIKKSYLVIAGTKNLSNLHHEAIQHEDGVVAVSSASLLDRDISLATKFLNHTEMRSQISQSIITNFFNENYYPFPANYWFNVIKDNVDGFYFNSSTVLKEDMNNSFNKNKGILYLNIPGLNQSSHLSLKHDSQNNYNINIGFSDEATDLTNFIFNNESNKYFTNKHTDTSGIGLILNSNPTIKFSLYNTRLGIPFLCGVKNIEFKNLHTNWRDIILTSKELKNLNSIYFLRPLFTHQNSSSSTSQNEFYIDNSIDSLTFYLNSVPGDSAFNNLRFELIDPNNRQIDSIAISGSEDMEYFIDRENSYAFYSIKKPTPGIWKVNYNSHLIDPFVIVPIMSPVNSNILIGNTLYSAGDTVNFKVRIDKPIEASNITVSSELHFKPKNSDSTFNIGNVNIIQQDDSTYSGKFYTSSAGNYSITSDFSCVYNSQNLQRRTGASVEVNSILPPVNVYPKTDSLSVPVTVNFKWRKSQNAVKYDFALYGLGDIIALNNQNNLVDTLCSVSGLTNNKQYFWNVRARTLTDTSNWSEGNIFTTIVNIPSEFELISPSDKSAGHIQPITFSWKKSVNASNYIFLLSGDSSFTSIVIQDSTLNDTVKIVNGLSSLNKYYWKVKAKNVAGYSVFSSVWSFKTLGIPNIVNPVYPKDTSLNNPVKQLFRWNRLADMQLENLSLRNTRDNIESIGNYWFEITSDTSNVSLFQRDSSLTDTLKSVSNLNYLTNYYWRVKARNDAGWGIFSNWKKFTTLKKSNNYFTNIVSTGNSIVSEFGLTNLIIENNVTTSGSIKVTYYPVKPVTDVLPSGIYSISGYYWKVESPDINFNNGFIKIKLNNIGGANSYEQLRWVKRSNPWDEWIDLGGEVTNGYLKNTITFDSFGEFAIVSTINQPLQSSFFNIKLIPQGFFNDVTGKLHRSDTLKGYLINSVSPYNIVDSSVSILDSSSLEALIEFRIAESQTYYIKIIHRNSIQTWSKSGGEVFTKYTTMNFDFTTSQSQAFGSNQIQIESAWCIYSGDVNQDEVIDASDMSEIENDAYNSVSGYVRTDLTGDDFVDAADMSIVDNNAFNSVSVIHP